VTWFFWVSSGELFSGILSGDDKIARITEGLRDQHGYGAIPNYVLWGKHNGIAEYGAEMLVKGFQRYTPEVSIFLLGNIFFGKC
jgi:hypothetical protein